MQQRMYFSTPNYLLAVIANMFMGGSSNFSFNYSCVCFCSCIINKSFLCCKSLFDRPFKNIYPLPNVKSLYAGNYTPFWNCMFFSVICKFYNIWLIIGLRFYICPSTIRWLVVSIAINAVLFNKINPPAVRWLIISFKINAVNLQIIRSIRLLMPNCKTS